MKRAIRPVEQGARHAQRLGDVRLLSEREAAEICHYADRGLRDPVRAFQVWARRAGVPVKYSGRRRLYDPRILEAFLDREPWTRRHRTVQTVSRLQRVG